eukprot:325542_1
MSSCFAFNVILSLLISIQAYVIDLASKDKRFDGIGGLSAGASSRLLIDYDEPYRSQILDFLFLPQFAASLQILKVEIGGDSWSTCGTESSHMHTSDINDINYYRGYEYWLMLEAKKRNPKIKIYALSWGFPAWIGSGALNENMANYTILWIKGAEEQLNITVNYIGIWNEDSWSASYVKLLRQMLNENNLNHVELVVADNFVNNVNPILEQIQNDSTFSSAFDIIGIHYPPSSTDTIGMWQSNKTLWCSEQFFTYNSIQGGGCWARVLNWDYIYGNYTATISWSIISSWYEYLPWYGDGLMNAAWPWNGYYEVSSPIWTSAHTTQFVDILNNDWYYIKQGYGSGILKYGGTYVTFISTNVNSNILNITIVIETMEYQHSLCRMSTADFWNVSIQNISFQLQDNNQKYILPKQLYVWQSVLVGDKTYLFEKQKMIDIGSDLSFILMNIVPNSVVTITTISSGNKGSYPTPPSKVKFPLPYSDNFDSYVDKIKNGIQPQPKYFSDQAGSFVVTDAMDKNTGDYAFEQVVPYSPSLNNTGWHNGDSPQPLTIIGDYNLTDYNVSVSAYIISNNQIYNDD